MSRLPLCAPPGYLYETTGPWFVAHIIDDDHAQAWVLWTLEAALLRFWLADARPRRRTMVDVMGITVLGTDSSEEGRTKMVGNRQTMEATLRIVETTPGISLEQQLEVVAMIEAIRSLDGQSL